MKFTDQFLLSPSLLNFLSLPQEVQLKQNPAQRKEASPVWSDSNTHVEGQVDHCRQPEPPFLTLCDARCPESSGYKIGPVIWQVSCRVCQLVASRQADPLPSTKLMCWEVLVSHPRRPRPPSAGCQVSFSRAVSRVVADATSVVKGSDVGAQPSCC